MNYSTIGTPTGNNPKLTLMRMFTKVYRAIRCWIGIHNYAKYTIGIYCTRCSKLKWEKWHETN